MNNLQMRKIIILTGPVHSGKSKALMEWVAGKHAAGFVTPAVEGKKVLFNIETAEISPFETEIPDRKSIEVGNYLLIKDTFAKAKGIIQKAIKQQDKEWIIIDEIGKLELKHKGHHSTLKELFVSWKGNILLVVRDYILQDVISRYRIKDAEVIDKYFLENTLNSFTVS
jgi:nucleoside-triphosphatase